MTHKKKKKHNFAIFESEEQFIGKTILVGITYKYRKRVLGQKQWWGKIIAFNDNDGLVIDFRNSGEKAYFPPFYNVIRVADKGTYRLRSTGEEIENPDYLLTLYSDNKEVPPPDSVIEAFKKTALLRKSGF